MKFTAKLKEMLNNAASEEEKRRFSNRSKQVQRK